jgi:hypothetical protein
MNYIKQLQAEKIQRELQAKYIYKQLIEIEAYYCSDKFNGRENDYAHVSTDVLVRLHELKMELVKLINENDF